MPGRDDRPPPETSACPAPPDQDNARARSASLSALCLTCGLCCEGSLFRYVRLAGDELVRLSSMGLETFRRRDGTPALRLGCSALRGTRCSIYDARPEGCRAFVCSLGLALLRGELSSTDALRRVLNARALVADVERHLPPAGPDDPRSAMQRAKLHGLLCGPAPLRHAEAFLEEHFLADAR